MMTWEEMDKTVSKGVAFGAFIAFLLVFIGVKLGSEMKFLKIMSFMFVLGSMFSLFKMYLVPQAKVDSDVDLISIVTIAVCTFSTLTNIANWYFARHYYNVS